MLMVSVHVDSPFYEWEKEKYEGEWACEQTDESSDFAMNQLHSGQRVEKIQREEK